LNLIGTGSNLDHLAEYDSKAGEGVMLKLAFKGTNGMFSTVAGFKNSGIKMLDKNTCKENVFSTITENDDVACFEGKPHNIKQLL
jgi:hypothetical protein